MFTLNQVVVAFIFGWLVCAASVVLGGWIEKIELYREYLRIRHRSRIHSGNIKYVHVGRQKYAKEK